MRFTSTWRGALFALGFIITSLFGSMITMTRCEAQPLLTSSLPSPKLISNEITAGQYQTAHDQLLQIIQADPTSAKAQYLLAVDDWKLGDFTGARTALDAAKSLDPSMKMANASTLRHMTAALYHHGISTSTFVLLLLVFGGIGAWSLWSMKRQRDNRLNPMSVGYSQPIAATVAQGTYSRSQPTAAGGYHVPPGRPLYNSGYASGGGYTPQASGGTTIINNNGGGNSGVGDLATGMLIGEMISQPRTIVEQPVVYEAPVAYPQSFPGVDLTGDQPALSNRGQDTGWNDQPQQAQPDPSPDNSSGGWNDNSGGSDNGGGSSTDDNW